MKFMTDIFEKMDEMVNISDEETGEVIFINRALRTRLGLADGENCRNRKYGSLFHVSSATGELSALSSSNRFRSYLYQDRITDTRFLIWRTLCEYEDRTYRVEVSEDLSDRSPVNSSRYYFQSESVLNQCMRLFFGKTDPEEALNEVLAYLGETFECGRVYIFESDEDGQANNTYEWCGIQTRPVREIMQNLSLSDLDNCWKPLLESGKEIIIPDVETLRTRAPYTYSMMKDQGVKAVAAGLIRSDENVMGFWGMDDPAREKLSQIASILNILGYFIAAQLKRRDMFLRLNAMSYRDALTGAYNRNALFEKLKESADVNSAAMIYCDISGLKTVNDTMGHDAGDDLICHVYQLIRKNLNIEEIYRVGGDEFVALYLNTERKIPEAAAEQLKQAVEMDECHVAVGCKWTEEKPIAFEVLMSQADKLMYEDKQKYYTANWMAHGVERRHRKAEPAKVGADDSALGRFASSTYTDIQSFFNSVAAHNSSSYFYFGDMQKNLFYISDNMRDEFGFRNNVVPGLLQVWEKRIRSQDKQDRYRRGVSDMLENKETVFDQRYQVRNIRGENIWVRSYGLMKWDETMTKPLFFSGRISHQDEEFEVDSVTNFPKYIVFLKYLDSLPAGHRKKNVLGFSLNNMTEINRTKGRGFADKLIRRVAYHLEEEFDGRLHFYRLEGMRFLALQQPDCNEDLRELAGQIRRSVEYEYQILNIPIHRPCSVALTAYSKDEAAPEEFLEHLNALIQVARQEQSMRYVDDSDVNLKKIRHMSDLSMALSRDVMNGMENFRVVVQPIISTENGKITGGETLMRWRFEGRDISPSVFIPAMEINGTIITAGRWVFEQAVRTCAHLVSMAPDFTLTVNISLHQLHAPTFSDFVKDTMKKYRLAGRHLTAELTESCMDEEPEKLVAFVEACTSCGIRVALDDFGTGYSSLRVLLKYPSSVIKLDRSLLEQLTSSEDKLHFISSLVFSCHRFGKKVCMEGVETELQNEMVKKCGCDMIQGFYYYQPMEREDVYRLLSATENISTIPM